MVRFLIPLIISLAIEINCVSMNLKEKRCFGETLENQIQWEKMYNHISALFFFMKLFVVEKYTKMLARFSLPIIQMTTDLPKSAYGRLQFLRGFT